jgi:hypothetical protein
VDSRGRRPPKVDQSEPSAKWGWLFLIIPVSVIVGVAFVASRRRQDSA